MRERSDGFEGSEVDLWLRTTDLLWDDDLDEVQRDHELACSIGTGRFDRAALALVAVALEQRWSIEFPNGLIEGVHCIGDIAHYGQLLIDRARLAPPMSTSLTARSASSSVVEARGPGGGLIEDRVGEVRPGEVGSGQVGRREVRTVEVRLGEIGAGDLRAIERCTGKVGPVQVAATEISSIEPCPGEIGEAKRLLP